MKNLRLLNLGRNKLTGPIPLELFNIVDSSDIEDKPLECRVFQNIVHKLRLEWFLKAYPLSKNNYLESLQILSLHENHLTGSIPTQLFTLKELVQLSLGRNNLVGDLPSEIGRTKLLEVLDIRK